MRPISTSTATAQLVVMGCYGIGPARIAAAAVEQFADDHGISWPRAIAPFDVHLVAIGKPGTPERDLADEALRRPAGGGIDVLYDDREPARARSSPMPSCWARRCA